MIHQKVHFDALDARAGLLKIAESNLLETHVSGPTKHDCIWKVDDYELLHLALHLRISCIWKVGQPTGFPPDHGCIVMP
jgi:hypothetical protein